MEDVKKSGEGRSNHGSSGISSESNKLSHTIAMLQPEIAQEVRDILMIVTDIKRNG